MLTNNLKFRKVRVKHGLVVRCFNVTKGDTCIGKGPMCWGCYCDKAYKQYSYIREAHERNTLLSMSPQFPDMMVGSIRRMRTRLDAVRPHSFGDFYSQEYLEKWFEIAERVTPLVYCYTKSLCLDFSGAPKNFHWIQSEGGKYDHLIDRRHAYARVFSTMQELEDAGFDDSTTELAAIQRKRKVGLVYHGPKAKKEVTCHECRD